MYRLLTRLICCKWQSLTTTHFGNTNVHGLRKTN